MHELGAEPVQGDLLDPASSAPISPIRLLKACWEATAIFGLAAREVGTEIVVNCSQLQNTAGVLSFRNRSHRLADWVLHWADGGAVHLHAPPFYANFRAFTAHTSRSRA